MKHSAQESPQPKHLYLVDGSGFIFRAYHSLPPLTRADGTPVGAVYGFTNMLLKLLDNGFHADYLAVVFDAARRTFRNDLYPEYKANRPPAPEDLIPQFPLTREATRALGIPAIELEGYEADDILATFARQARERGWEVTIVSSDKDLMQLVGEGVKLYDGMKDKEIGPKEVEEKFGVPPGQVADALALIGDASDNVPGVPGIGPKTAAELLRTYGSLEGVLSHASEIKQQKRRETIIENTEKARLSRKLVELVEEVPLPVTLDDLAVKEHHPETLLAFLKEQGFRSLVARFEKQHGVEQKSLESGVRSSVKQHSPTTENQQPATVSYELIQDLPALQKWLAEIEKAGFTAFDCETTSLDAMRAELVGFSLSVGPGKAAYVPVGHRLPKTDLFEENANADALRQIPLNEALALIKPVLENPGILKIGQNIKYDMLVLRRYGIFIAPVDDTMLMSYVLDSSLHRHNMDELSKLFLDITPVSYAEVTGTGKSQKNFSEVSLEDACRYAAEDADITLRLSQALKPRLQEERMRSVYETLERPLIPVLVEMEEAGILVDREVLAALSRDFAARLAELEEEVFALAGHSFNIGSPQQLGEVLFKEMGLEGGKKGKSGAYATDASVLEELVLEGHRLPEKVLEWRQIAKLKSTYSDALIGQINPRTGRVHTSYAMAVTSTGRLSSTDPNLQNIPIRTEEGRKIRRAFIPAPGHVLISADYSQIELRLLAHMADITPLKEAFLNGEDIHAATASQVFGIPKEAVDAEYRRKAKTINFGIIYGMSAFGLASRLGIGNKEAAGYIEAYFARYPGIRDYMERTREFCRKHGFVTTLFGRKCHVQGITDKNPNRRGFAERAAINAPLQGTAADILKRAMIRMPGALRESGLKTKMLLTVHDELVFEAPNAETDQALAVIRKVMEGAASLSVPLTVEVGTGKNWGEAH